MTGRSVRPDRLCQPHAQPLLASGSKSGQFRKTADHEFICFSWFERDRCHLRLETPRGRVVFELWDDAVEQAVVDGFLKPPCRPHPTGADWQPELVAYARGMGLIE